MTQYYKAGFLKMLRNQIPIDKVISRLLNIEVQKAPGLSRFRCPLCNNFHTATNPNTNLARCFECQKNFNPIDMVMTVGKCSFIEAVEILKNNTNL